MTRPAQPRHSAVAVPRLRKRREYVAMRGGERIVKPGFVLVTRRRAGREAAPAGRRVGFTVTKRTGNAVERNRIRRRLKEAARHALVGRLGGCFDHVLIGRRAALAQDFGVLVGDLAGSLDRAATMVSKPRRVRRRRSSTKD